MTEVVWITPTFPWAGQPVTGSFYRTQAEALARLGYGVHVLSPTPWAPWPLRELRPQWRAYARALRDTREAGVRILRPRYLNVPGQPDWAIPDRLIARAAWRSRADWAGAQLVHGHSAVEGLAAWRLARRAGLPLVLTFHGSDMNTWPEAHPDRLGDLRRAIREAALVIAVSGALGERIRAMSGVAATHLPIGTNLRALAESAIPQGEARRILDLPDDRIVVLFVGNLLRAKGVRELADAVLDLGHPFLGVFVGSGGEFGYGTDRAATSELLHYVGERRHSDVIRYMCAADVLVLPSYSEGLPTVLVEAGALGLPTIASSVGGIPELLAPDRGVILPTISMEAVAASLRLFAGNPDRASAAADRLRAHVSESYDVDANTARLIDHYSAILGP